jgi:hypothetical protein
MVFWGICDTCKKRTIFKELSSFSRNNMDYSLKCGYTRVYPFLSTKLVTGLRQKQRISCETFRESFPFFYPRANRLHLDLYTDNREGEVKRLLKIGATRHPQTYEPDDDFLVLEDPDGNLFCVVQT